MARLDIRYAGRLRLSKYVDPQTVDFTVDGDKVTLTATVVAAPVAPAKAPKPVAPAVPQPELPKPELHVEPEKPAEEVSGVANLSTGEVTDPDTGETVATINTNTGEVVNTEGEVVGAVDLDQDGGVLDIVDNSGEVVGVVEVTEGE